MKFYKFNSWLTQPVYYEKINLYFLFSSLKFSIEYKKRRFPPTQYPLYLLELAAGDKKCSINNCIFVFLQTQENLFNFIKFFAKFSNKLKILNLSKKLNLQLEGNYIYLILKNKLNSIGISTNLKNSLKNENSNFNQIKDIPAEGYFITEILGGKIKFLVFNTIETATKNFIVMSFYKKIKVLALDLKYQNFHCILNFVNLRIARNSDYFFSFLNLMIKHRQAKIIIIINELSFLKTFSIKPLSKNILFLPNFSSVHHILKDLKKFNSSEKFSFFIESAIWKEKNLFNRIDPRNLTVILKIILNKKQGNIYEIKSFFYF